MNVTTSQALGYCQENLAELNAIEDKIILCPPTPAITAVCHILKDTHVAVCAQSCSEHEEGAYTGQVSAKSLAQAGCSYVMVGHSEERKAFSLTNEQVAEKALRVLEAGMIPLICINETAHDKETETTIAALEEQLLPIKRTLKGAPAYIIYEPLWIQDVENTPTNAELSSLFAQLKLFMQGCAFMYGGTLNEKNVTELKKLPDTCGFMVETVSVNFQDLKKIVS